MPRTGELIQVLRDLGLTPTEAEVYVATLEAAADGPVSGYRVAQGVGRDPANLAKVMASLVRQGAVRVVQDKPRLYLPMAPDDFSAGIVKRLSERRGQALDLMRAFAPPDPGGAPLLLATFADAIAAATGLAAGASSSVLLYAPVAVVSVLAEPLAMACARPGCRVGLLCPEPVGLVGCESTLVAGPGDGSTAWIQLVCDRRRWLVARAGDSPAGCGGEQAGVAGVLAESLDVARRAGGLQAETMALAAAAGLDRPRVQPAPEPRRDGLTFLIKHDRPKT